MKLSILCVDDEIPGLFLRKMVLEAHGYRVVTASTGQEAFTFAESMHFDAVILDFNMPEISGGEIAERLRRELPHLKIIMLSGYPEDVSPEIQGLMDAFVCKGGSPNELLQAIRTALDGKVQDGIESNPYVLFGNNPLIPELRSWKRSRQP
ncbi:MAG TPA: response regulator transcription factor [Terriglobales bacterium]|nr:response regulator transcription factor [Terriglobales bacterium]